MAINKPQGLAVHRSDYVGNVDVFAVQMLRDQLEKYVYPCHRIDRKTSGVLLFTLDEKSNIAVHLNLVLKSLGVIE